VQAAADVLAKIGSDAKDAIPVLKEMSWAGTTSTRQEIPTTLWT
jgi:hypothetical protein